MIILDGKSLAEEKKAKLRERIVHFKNSYGRVPRLAVVLVGEDPASQIYVRNKIKSCESVGIQSSEYVLRASTSQAELVKLVHELNRDEGVDGILIQLPLPAQIDTLEVISQILPHKDADGLSYESCGRLLSGTQIISPCTPSGIINLLDKYQISCDGKLAVVIGRSQIVGKPMVQLLSQRNATVIWCHSKTKNLKSFTAMADILVVAVGKKNLIGKGDVKGDAVVIDVGMNREEKKLVGDVNQEDLAGNVHAMTPVPGGVGPMTIVTLLENTAILAEAREANKARGMRK